MIGLLFVVDVALITGAVLLGRDLARRPRRVWVPVVIASIAVVAVTALRSRGILPSPWGPVDLFLGGRRFYIAQGVAIALPMATLGPQLSTPLARRLIVLLLGIVIASRSFFPLAFHLVASEPVPEDEPGLEFAGVCRQSTPYTCGPAAAATALRALGRDAAEWDLAVACASNPLSGTQPQILAVVLDERYGDSGLEFEFRRFDDLDEVLAADGALVVIEFTLGIDHWVSVLASDSETVLLGDPANGRRAMPRAEFEDIWRGTAVVIREHPVTPE